ncbi:MAG: AAA family ATPase [Cyanobium sp.]
MSALISALLRPEAYDHPVAAIRVLETHISWVLLTGTYAYKIKKPVDLGFLDFSTLERRRHFCQEELRLNQRLSPELYLGLRSIHGPPERASLHGTTPEVEVAVMMHQFRQEDLLPAVLRRRAPLAERLLLIESFADRLAGFHAAAAVAPGDSDFGSPQRVQEPALANLEVLQRILGADPRLPPLHRWCLDQARQLAPVFAERRRLRRVREGHGDLHLGNLVLHQDRIVAFDALEFSPALRWIDVISDIAFLAMDLARQRQPLLAAALLDRWLSHSGDYAGLATWRWYLVYRALVRAKVTALRLQQAEASPAAERRRGRADLRAYLQLATASTGSTVPVLLITHGVSGSGKSHQARQLARQLGWLHVRSDVERLRLFGRWGEACAAPRQGDPYSAAVSEALYGERLIQCCRSALAAGLSVICDATFLQRWQRQLFRDLAVKQGARFVILGCCCPPDLARRRIVERRLRGGDPSEADASVLQRQLACLEPLTAAEQKEMLVVRAESSGGGCETSARPEPSAKSEMSAISDAISLPQDGREAPAATAALLASLRHLAGGSAAAE